MRIMRSYNLLIVKFNLFNYYYSFLFFDLPRFYLTRSVLLHRQDFGHEKVMIFWSYNSEWNQNRNLEHRCHMPSLENIENLFCRKPEKKTVFFFFCFECLCVWGFFFKNLCKLKRRDYNFICVFFFWMRTVFAY